MSQADVRWRSMGVRREKRREGVGDSREGVSDSSRP
jgi:hypothetical protein